jgi:hypothetical protein
MSPPPQVPILSRRKVFEAPDNLTLQGSANARVSGPKVGVRPDGFVFSERLGPAGLASSRKKFAPSATPRSLIAHQVSLWVRIFRA